MSLAQVGSAAAAMREAFGCHTAQQGEVCYTKALWVAQVGIREHPDWYPALTVRSGFREVQAALHAAGAAGCEEPCPEPARGDRVPDVPLRPDRELPPAAPTQLEPVGAASTGTLPWASRCNPTSCLGGLTCKGPAGGREERCCQPDDWECCGSGDEKFTDRMYCPAEGVYTIMCANGFCMAREEDCEGRGGVWYGARTCGSMPYAGCSPEEPGDAVLQARPPTCSSMEECQCGEAYPMVAYRIAAAAGGRAGQVTWSCLPTKPALLNSSGCAELGGWRTGVASGSIGVYVNPNFRGTDPLPGSGIQEFTPGQHVEAKYTDGNWYGATISEAQADGGFKVAWDDGDLRDRAKDAKDVRASSIGDEEFTVGEYVQARFGDGKWYGATVAEAHRDGTFKIRWNDGDGEETKRPDDLRGSRSGSSPSGKYVIGQHVEARFSDGDWYGAMLTQFNPDRTFTINWDDGGVEDGKGVDELRPGPWDRPDEEFTLGEYVQARFSEDGGWYGATVVKVNPGGTFEIRWDDGGTADRAKRPEDLRGSRSAASAMWTDGEYFVGQHVEGRFSDGEWYPAMVTKANDDGTFKITWDDGTGDDDGRRPEELRPWQTGAIPLVPQAFTAGEYVQARFKDGKWYGATVLQAHSDGTFEVRWNDGTGDDTKRPEDLRGGSGAGAPSDGKYMVGQHVEGKFSDGDWYGAMVTQANPNGTFRLGWDDGGDTDGLRPDELRPGPWGPGAGGAPPSEADCHTAVPGEPCHELILWSIQVGIPGHPQWEGGALARNATPEEIQASLARNGNSGCPRPCPLQATAEE